MEIRGFIVKNNYPDPIVMKNQVNEVHSVKYICHCDDVKLDEILKVIGDRKFISVDEIKHTTRLGMGACRGKRCIKRLKQTLGQYDKAVVGEATPRGPMSNQVEIGELYPAEVREIIITNINGKKHSRIKVDSLIAGGGIAGSALFRYMAESGIKPFMINFGKGASWRNIAGGRPNFSLPELSDISTKNLAIFKELHRIENIDFRLTNYVTFAHDETMHRDLEASMKWSNAEMIAPKDFKKRISPYINTELNTYLSALVTKDCWQATPGKVIDLIRRLGIEKGGIVLEDCKLEDLSKTGNTYNALVKTHDGKFVEYETDVFINALGPEGGEFTKKLGIQTGIYSVKHQAFITRRLPMMGVNGDPLPMMIDRRNYKGFVAVYGQQLAETGQIIGCASPAVDPLETDKSLKINSKEFLEITSEIFVNWLPNLSSVGIQAVWAGYYVEPRMIIDPQNGLFLGLRGQGYMLGQYLARLYVDQLTGKQVPEYFKRLSLSGDGMPEIAFK